MKDYEKRNFSLGRTAKGDITSKEFRISSFYSPSPVDTFLHNVHKAPHDSRESIRLTSDIYMLFNQQRLDKMTLQQLSVHFNNIASRDSSFAALKSKLTDEQLASIVKSRYIQAPSELLAYSRYLNSLGDEQLQAYAAQLQAQQSEQSKPSDSKPAPASGAPASE